MPCIGVEVDSCEAVCNSGSWQYLMAGATSRAHLGHASVLGKPMVKCWISLMISVLMWCTWMEVGSREAVCSSEGCSTSWLVQRLGHIWGMRHYWASKEYKDSVQIQGQV